MEGRPPLPIKRKLINPIPDDLIDLLIHLVNRQSLLQYLVIPWGLVLLIHLVLVLHQDLEGALFESIHQMAEDLVLAEEGAEVDEAVAEAIAGED